MRVKIHARSGRASGLDAAETIAPGRIATMSALAQVILPAGGALPGAGDVGLASRVTGHIESMPATLRRRVGALITFFDLAPIAVSGFRKSFVRLSPEEREKYVLHVEEKGRFPEKLALAYLKQLIVLSYASSHEVESILGFDYTCRLDGEVHGR